MLLRRTASCTELNMVFFVDEKGKPVQLVYEAPKEIKNLSRITMDIHSTDCKSLWDRSVEYFWGWKFDIFVSLISF